MATEANYKNKFLDIIGLQQLVTEIKNRFTATTDISKLNSAEYNNTTDTITIHQGANKEHHIDVTLTTADTSVNGLMSTAHVDKLNHVDADKVQRVCVSVDRSNVADTLRYDLSTANDKLAIIDYTTKLNELTDVTRRQAPTAGAVKDQLDTKVDKTTYGEKIEAIEKTIADNKTDIENALSTKAEELTKTIADNKADIEKKLSDAQDQIAQDIADTKKDIEDAQTIENNGMKERLTNLETFKNVVGTKATNVYNKQEVDAAITAAKAAIVGGDEDARLQETYKTLIAISDWIEANDSAEDATGISKAIADNAAAIALNKAAIESNDGDIEAIQNEITAIKTADNAVSLKTLDNRLSTAEETIENHGERLTQAEKDIDALEGRATALETALGDANNSDSILGRLKTAEADIDTNAENIAKNAKAITDLDTKLDTAKANRTEAVGSIEELVWNGTTNAYEMVYKSVSGAELDRVSFPVFTAADITALFA